VITGSGRILREDWAREPPPDAVIRGDDDGLLRGDGAFEVLMLHRGRPFARRQHLDRLRTPCDTLRLPLPDGGWPSGAAPASSPVLRSREA
jgi:4-amino-4-deoxychorismate lyase